MKAEIVETKVEFKPITITLTIETAEELSELWHRLNIQRNAFNGDSFTYTSSNYLSVGFGDKTISLWRVIDNAVERLGFKRSER